MILGIDEVGRGCWAGPLVVGAVVFDGKKPEGLTDSKKLSKKRREQLDVEIKRCTSGIGLGWVMPVEIDEIGLGAALRLATKRAVRDVQASGVRFESIIIDGTINFMDDTPLAKHTSTLKKADLLISSVSAASIIAKVARDAYMYKQSALFPEYGFLSHVGYGTAKHRAAIEQFGVTPLHRLSIAPLAKYRSATIVAKDPDDFTTKTTRAIGDESETVACVFLCAQGHEIIVRNWRTKYCEIDVVSKKDDIYYFTEVKHRSSHVAGGGIAAITPTKLRQMTFAAKLYAQKNNVSGVDMRLLAIATKNNPPEISDVIELQ